MKICTECGEPIPPEENRCNATICLPCVRKMNERMDAQCRKYDEEFAKELMQHKLVDVRIGGHVVSVDVEMRIAVVNTKFGTHDFDFNDLRPVILAPG